MTYIGVIIYITALEIAFENIFFLIFFFSFLQDVFVTPVSQLNHDMFDFVYICKAYASDLIPFVERW